MKIVDRIYVTKWALTQGILTYQNAKVTEGKAHVRFKSFKGTTVFENGDWYLSEAAAIDHCKTLRARRLRNLQEQIEQLAEMEFRVPDFVSNS